MSREIEDAANAFDAAMGGETKQTAAPSNDAKPAEALFENLNRFTDDGDEEAGGDNEPVRPRAPDGKFTKKKAGEDGGDDDDGAAGGDDIEYELDADGNVVLGEDGLPVEKVKTDDDDGEDGEDDILAKKFTVTVDGEEVEVEVKEALNGYIRQETFHRRLNKLDEVQRAVAEQADKVIESRQKAIDRLAEIEQQAKELLPEEPDWDKLFNENPAQARTLQKNYDNILAKIEGVKKAREEEANKLAQEEHAKLEEFARAEFPKFAQKAKWTNDAQMKGDLIHMRKSAMEAGFSEEEVAQVYDSRMLTILLKASKYDRIMAARPKAVKNGQPGKAPGAGKRTAPKGIDRAQAKLNRTGSVDDAAAVFQRILG